MRKTNAEYAAKYRASNPDYVKRMNLKRLYNITLEEYEAMRAAQGYCCAICDRHEDDIEEPGARGRPRKDGQVSEVMKLQVDHCHTSTKVRKLLCGACNRMLAGARDNAAVLRAGAEYLREHGSDTPRG